MPDGKSKVAEQRATPPDTIIKLPGKADVACVGVSGRYILLRLPAEKQLAVVDVAEARVVKTLPIGNGSNLFAAGKDALVIVDPGAKTCQRYDLKTFDAAEAMTLPITGRIQHIAMGSASAGPLAIATDDGPLFINPVTSKQFDYETGAGLLRRAGPQVDIRMSADGRVLAVWGARIGVHTLDGSALSSAYGEGRVRTLMPSADGHLLFTQGNILGTDAQQIGLAAGRHSAAAWYVPAVQGRYYLALNQANQTELSIDIRLPGHERPLLHCHPSPERARSSIAKPAWPPTWINMCSSSPTQRCSRS